MKKGLVNRLAIPIIAGVLIAGCSKERKIESIEQQEKTLQEQLTKLQEKKDYLEHQEERDAMTTFSNRLYRIKNPKKRLTYVLKEWRQPSSDYLECTNFIGRVGSNLFTKAIEDAWEREGSFSDDKDEKDNYINIIKYSIILGEQRAITSEAFYWNIQRLEMGLDVTYGMRLKAIDWRIESLQNPKASRFPILPPSLDPYHPEHNNNHPGKIPKGTYSWVYQDK